MPNTLVTHLECSLCNRKFEAGKVWNLCECGGPLLVRYDLARLREDMVARQLRFRAEIDVALRTRAARPARNLHYLTRGRA